MRKKLIIYLSSLFLLFTLGAGLTMFYTSHATNNLKDIIELHRIDIIRHDLAAKANIVQSNLYATGTVFGKELDIIINNVIEMDKSIRQCSGCHHSEEMIKQFKKLEGRMEDYKEAISYLVTTTANEKRIERLKMVALNIGDSILSESQDMIIRAGKSLNDKTISAIERINRTRFILFSTLAASFVVAVFIAFLLARQITSPLSEMLKATREIAAGNIGYEVSYNDPTEFGELARNFNSMSTALKENYEEIKRRQNEIVESERRFRTLSEFSQDWDYWISENGDIIFNSPSCEKITGYSQNEFIEKPNLLNEIIYPEDEEAFRKHLENFKSPEHFEIEFRIATKDGGVKWLSHVCNPIYVEGEFRGRRVSNRDITDRKRLEEQLRQSQKMESLGLFAGGIAHDFNNILTVIDGYSRFLKAIIGDRDEKINNYIQQIIDASKRAQRLTSSLLSFSRKQIMRPQPVMVNNVIEEISKFLKRLIGEDIELRLIFNKPEEALPVFADPHQIEQVIMNLAANARDAMPEGGKLTIETARAFFDQRRAREHGCKPGDYMMISVSDTGIGIDKELLPHIFEPFFTTKEKGKGTGLGLSIIYGIIKQHEGLINVYSEKGIGTTFKIYLPAMKKAEEMVHKEEKAFVGADIMGSETILLAEDDDSVREFLRDAIEGYGYSVLLAVDGEEAIKMYEADSNKIDIVILDVIMPKKNGKEVYNHIKKIDPEIKVIFISGYTEDILTSKGIYEEGLEFISKPVNINELMKKIRGMLGTAAS